MTNMPDLSDEQQVQEQRKVIKFWVDRCKKLEKENETLKEKVNKFYGQ